MAESAQKRQLRIPRVNYDTCFASMRALSHPVHTAPDALLSFYGSNRDSMLSTHDEPTDSWIDALQSGDNDAVTRLWDQFFDRMVRVAERRIDVGKYRTFDGEDVAVSAFASVCRRVERGEYQNLHSQNDLWKLLLKVTQSKLIDRIRKGKALKRGGGAVRGESAFGLTAQQSAAMGIGQVAGEDVPPEILVAIEEDHQQLMGILGDPSLTTVATMRMQGYSVVEIAAEIGLSDRSVKRKLERIRRTWEAAFEETQNDKE